MTFFVSTNAWEVFGYFITLSRGKNAAEILFLQQKMWKVKKQNKKIL
jgi:hypothetical protein